MRTVWYGCPTLVVFATGLWLNLTALSPGRADTMQHWRAPAWSVFREASYCSGTQTLWIRFRSGHEYLYRGVAPDVFSAFMRTRDKAAFFNRHIRRNHGYDRVDYRAAGLDN